MTRTLPLRVAVVVGVGGGSILLSLVVVWRLLFLGGPLF